ncbi:prepilin-type N-terminal cleavage/methylation domain-containing protein [Sedimenticola hydrogenitrophicus]|uniref:prepilin-type N-terminal cleavage/methylation domain-containing protein n=1 Tax=Sedimenticola hydrogenitrophicus TaxID=2967975 RepID=UPI003AAFCBD8
MHGADPAASHHNRTAQRGFTLVELVVVLLLVGILAAVGMPRFFNQLTFQEWGFSDELAGALRFGQKLAIATGCDTQAAITAAGYQLNQRVTCNSGAFTTPVRLPGGDGTGYAGSAPGGIALTAASLYFDALGRPHDSADGNLLAAATNIAIGSRSVSVEPQTGYVH